MFIPRYSGCFECSSAVPWWSQTYAVYCINSYIYYRKNNSTLLAEPLAPSKHYIKVPWITRKTIRLGSLPHYPLLSMPHQVPLHSPMSGSIFLRMAVLPCHEAAVAQLLTSCFAFPAKGMSLTSHSPVILTCEALSYTTEVCWLCFKVLDGERCCTVPLLLSWARVQAHPWL